jgi:hypothetical protein
MACLKGVSVSRLRFLMFKNTRFLHQLVGIFQKGHGQLLADSVDQTLNFLFNQLNFEPVTFYRVEEATPFPERPPRVHAAICASWYSITSSESSI